MREESPNVIEGLFGLDVPWRPSCSDASGIRLSFQSHGSFFPGPIHDGQFHPALLDVHDSVHYIAWPPDLAETEGIVRLASGNGKSGWEVQRAACDQQRMTVE